MLDREKRFEFGHDVCLLSAVLTCDQQLSAAAGRGATIRVDHSWSGDAASSEVSSMTLPSGSSTIAANGPVVFVGGILPW